MSVALTAAVPGHAQSPAMAAPTLTQAPQFEAGFVSPYEIVKTVRRAGFAPLSPPLREGTIYVLRATDFRGILMRVVVDARSGAIRDANRIVPGPGQYGQIGVDYDPATPPNEELEPPGLRAPSARIVSPPLPRPRPASLASRRPDENAGADPHGPKGRASASNPTTVEQNSKAPSPTNSDVMTTAPPPPAAPAAPKKTPDVLPLND